jgi:hypothetical protein
VKVSECLSLLKVRCIVIAATVIPLCAVSALADTRVPGAYLIAWRVVLPAFESDPSLPPAEKRLKNYDVVMYETAHDIFFEFVPRPGPKDNLASDIGCQSEFGRDMEYTVDKATLRIVRYIKCK